MDMVYLEIKIAESGLKREYIAAKLGLTRYGFRDKLLYPERWRVEEVAKLIPLLKLSKADVKRIFCL